jgi:hypothetical protein
MNLTQRPASAYIDGGLAAMLLQGAIGGVLAAALYIKVYWQNIKARFSGSKESPVKPDEGGPKA